MRIVRHLCLNASVGLTFSWACFGSAAIAADFEISIQVKSATGRLSTKSTDEQPSPLKPHPRPVFTTKAKETLLISWTATNNAKQATFHDVLIHCFVVAEKEPGQAGLPDLKDPTQESALTMDFKPGDRATGEFSLAIDTAGTYLVRVETRNLPDDFNHEPYAALDLTSK